jgi:peptidoglycan/xylan/chitin deacetylase (PgdA/CDA1 family)
MKPPDAPHGVLAHYFCATEAERMQGALTVDEWQRLLDAYGDRVLSARDWIARAVAGTLEDEVCVTFDDGLREAYVHALPALEERALQAAWYPYTQVLVGVPHELERYRWIRNRAYGALDGFYAAWWKHVRAETFVTSMPKDYLADRGYLTDIDRAFRWWRNELVNAQDYAEVMDALDVGAPFAPESHWLTSHDLWTLERAGHILGTHGHTHAAAFQAVDWATAHWMLPATTASYPYGAYSDEARDWLQAHGYVLAWGATMQGSWPWCVPRWSTGYWTA